MDINLLRNKIQRSNREVHGSVINIFIQKPKKFGDRTWNGEIGVYENFTVIQLWS